MALFVLDILQNELVLQARLSRGRRESGQVPIRLLCCILSSRAPNEVGVNMNETCSGLLLKRHTLQVTCYKR